MLCFILIASYSLYLLITKLITFGKFNPASSQVSLKPFIFVPGRMFSKAIQGKIIKK